VTGQPPRGEVAIIPTRNRLETLQECIGAIRGQTHPVAGIIVVDNESTDGTPEWLAAQTDLTVIRQGDAGNAGGLHTGFRAALRRGYDAFWVLDDDAIATPECLERLVRAPAYDPDTVVASLVLSREDPGLLAYRIPRVSSYSRLLDLYLRVHEKADDLRRDSDELGYPWAMFLSSILIPRGIVEDIGLPRPDFYLGANETEYFYRARVAGVPMYIIPDSILYHPLRRLGGEPAWRQKYFARNTAFIHRHYRRWAWLRFAVKAARNVVRGKAYLVRPMLDGLRGDLSRWYHLPPGTTPTPADDRADDVHGGRVTAVVVTCDRPEQIESCVKAVRAQTRPPDQIVVVDQGTDLEIADWLDRQDDVTLVRQDNQGPAGGYRSGMRRAFRDGAAAAWLIDDDGIPEPEALERLLTAPANDGRTVVGSLVVSTEDPNRLAFALPRLRSYSRLLDYFKQDFDRVDDVVAESDGLGYAWGSFWNSVLFPRRVVEEVGLPERRLFLGGEETEYFYRVRSRGFQTYLILDSRASHPVRTIPRSREQLQARNATVIHRRYRRWFTLRTLKRLLVAALRGRWYLIPAIWHGVRGDFSSRYDENERAAKASLSASKPSGPQRSSPGS
jgi:GT2 family glycosyltransferase